MGKGWCDKIQSDDRANWTDSNGVKSSKAVIALPSKAWAWISDWEIERQFLDERNISSVSVEHDGACDADGW